MQEIEITGNEPEEIDYSLMLKECTMDLDKHVPEPDVIIYYGFDDKGKEVSLLTRGEFSAIVAQSKTKKSFNKSLIEAAFMGGKTNNYTNHIRCGVKKNKGWLISIDTEQGEYYAHNTFKRTERISGCRYDKYKPIQTRSKTVEERIALIDYIVFESEYAGNIDLLVIDGVADLVYNTNDIETSTKVASKMLQWTSIGKLHLMTVIHKTGSSDKARGHLGTSVQIKTEAIILMDSLTDEKGDFIMNEQGFPERNTVKVRCGMSRGKPFEEFFLRIDNDGLPFTFNEVSKPEHPKKEYSDVCEGVVSLPMPSPEDVFSADDETPF